MAKAQSDTPAAGGFVPIEVPVVDGTVGFTPLEVTPVQVLLAAPTTAPSVENQEI